MAEPISLASGLLTLAIFAHQSSITLCKTVRSFQDHPKRVRDLENELNDLSGVLGSLKETVGATADIDLSVLDQPLLRCGRACEDFEKELLKCSSRSNSNRTSFRDWARLRYRGDDIDGFRNLLANYKATISIALNDVNLRKSSITAEGIEKYRDEIKTTTNDLESRLQSIDEKLDTIFTRTATESDATELREIQEERLSTLKCLQICAQLSEHLNQIQPIPLERSRRGSVNIENTPEWVASEGIEQCRISIEHTTAKLERRMQDLIDRWLDTSKTTMTPDDIEELKRLQEDWKTARQCVDICSKAEGHLKASISIIDNQATGDEAVQFLVSTSQKTIHGKNRGEGFRIRQIGGHLSDESLQQLSRDISRISLPSTAISDPTMQGENASNSDDLPGKAPYSDFDDRYGRGIKLTPETELGHPGFSKPS